MLKCLLNRKSNSFEKSIFHSRAAEELLSNLIFNCGRIIPKNFDDSFFLIYDLLIKHELIYYTYFTQEASILSDINVFLTNFHYLKQTGIFDLITSNIHNLNTANIKNLFFFLFIQYSSIYLNGIKYLRSRFVIQ